MAESLLSLNYSGLPNRLKSNYISRITDIIIPVLSSNEFVSSILDRINAELENIKLLTARGKSSSYTKVISEKDQKRDKVFNGIIHLIKSQNLLSDDPLVIRASEVLLHVFGKLGKNVTNQSYSRENVLLKALFKSLEETEAASAIKTLGIEKEIEKLKKSQKEFEEAVSKKVDERSALDGKKSLDAYRSLSKHFSALMSHIQYNIEMGVSSYTGLIFPLNQIIAEANMSAGQPDSSEKDQDSEENPEETETIAG